MQPHERLTQEQVKLVDQTSREILENPGVLCYNKRAVEVFREAGAPVEDLSDCSRIRITAEILNQVLESVPSRIVLGARNPDNRLILDAHEPRVRFGSGSETNIWLDVEFENSKPVFKREKGNIERLCRAAHLCDNLENLDFFIRCVNIQDEEIDASNKDVNKFFHSLNHITKHVQAGLTSLDRLDDVIRLGQMVAGGQKAFEENPVLSFIACVVKSPLQIVDDTAETFIEVAKRRVPIVVSSCPMGGATGPFDEFGMVALINAELLAGITLNQLVSPGAPILYGAVPVRTRLDDLNDMYAAPEFVNYNMDCAQMARFYGVPCYSTSGVADAEVPGIQATAEKVSTFATVPFAGAQYIHYAFGLLERTNVFCPVQAVMDDAHIGFVKEAMRQSNISESNKDSTLSLIREVMDSSHKTFVYHLPCPTREKVYVSYPLEDKEHGALVAANKKYREILNTPGDTISDELQKDILKQIPGIIKKNLSTEVFE